LAGPTGARGDDQRTDALGQLQEKAVREHLSHLPFAKPHARADPPAAKSHTRTDRPTTDGCPADTGARPGGAGIYVIARSNLDNIVMVNQILNIWLTTEPQSTRSFLLVPQ
jgi:hypothetical protein